MSLLFITSLTIATTTASIEKLGSGGAQRKPKLPKGTRDQLPEQMRIREQAFQVHTSRIVLISTTIVSNRFG
jgi:hypothetical protein